MYPSYELLTTLLAAAVQFSGLPAIHVSELPPVVVLSREELSDTVCAKRPGRCNSLMAAFDTNSYRILVSNSLDLDDQRDNSFLVHEIVHVLQFKQAGTAKFTSCRAVVSSEYQAYAAQNQYLMANGRVGQEGSTLRYVRCPEAEDEEAPASSDMPSTEKKKPD